MNSSFEVSQSANDPNAGSNCCNEDNAVCSVDVTADSASSSLLTSGSDSEQVNPEQQCAVDHACINRGCVTEMTEENENSDSRTESPSAFCQDLIVGSAGVSDNVAVDKLDFCGEAAQLDLKTAVVAQHSAEHESQCSHVTDSNSVSTQLSPDIGKLEGSNSVECRKRPSMDQDNCEIYAKLQKFNQSFNDDSVGCINKSDEAFESLSADQQILGSAASLSCDASNIHLLDSCSVGVMPAVNFGQPQKSSLQQLQSDVPPKLQQAIENEILVHEAGDQSDKHLTGIHHAAENVAVSSVASATNNAAYVSAKPENDTMKCLVNRTEGVELLPPPPAEKDSCSAAKMRKRMEALLGPKLEVGNEMSACKQNSIVNDQVPPNSKSDEAGDQDSQVLNSSLLEAKQTNAAGHEETDIHNKCLTESVSVDSHRSDSDSNLDFVGRLKNSKRLMRESLETSNKMSVPLMSLKASEALQLGNKKPAPLMSLQPPDSCKPKYKSFLSPTDCEADISSCSKPPMKNVVPLMDCSPLERPQFHEVKKAMPQLESGSSEQRESTTVKPIRAGEIKGEYEISLSEDERKAKEICERSRMSQLESETETAASSDMPFTCDSIFVPSAGSSTDSASIDSQFQCLGPHHTRAQQTETPVPQSQTVSRPSVCLSQLNDCSSLAVSSTAHMPVGPPASSFCRPPLSLPGQQISGCRNVHPSVVSPGACRPSVAVVSLPVQAGSSTNGISQPLPGVPVSACRPPGVNPGQSGSNGPSFGPVGQPVQAGVPLDCRPTGLTLSNQHVPVTSPVLNQSSSVVPPVGCGPQVPQQQPVRPLVGCQLPLSAFSQSNSNSSAPPGNLPVLPPGSQSLPVVTQMDSLPPMQLPLVTTSLEPVSQQHCQTDGKISVLSSQQFITQLNSPAPADFGSHSMEVQAGGSIEMVTSNQLQTGNLNIECRPPITSEVHCNAPMTVSEQAGAQVLQPQPVGLQTDCRLSSCQPRLVLSSGDLVPPAQVSQPSPVLPSSDLTIPTPVNQPRPVPPPGDLLPMGTNNQPPTVPCSTNFRSLAPASQPKTVTSSTDLVLPSPVSQPPTSHSTGNFRLPAVAPTVGAPVNFRPTAPSFDCKPS
jgi:hypothetical protein